MGLLCCGFDSADEDTQDSLQKQMKKRGQLVSTLNSHMFETGTLKQIEGEMRRQLALLLLQSEIATPRTRHDINVNVSVVHRMFDEMDKGQRVTQVVESSDSETASVGGHQRGELITEENSYLFRAETLKYWESEMRQQLESMQNLNARVAGSNKEELPSSQFEFPDVPSIEVEELPFDKVERMDMDPTRPKRERVAPNVAPMPEAGKSRGELISTQNCHMFETGTLVQIEQDMRKELELLLMQSEAATPRTRCDIDANVSLVQRMLEEMEKEECFAHFSDSSDSETISVDEPQRSQLITEENSYLFREQTLKMWESEMREQLESMQNLNSRVAASKKQKLPAPKNDLPNPPSLEVGEETIATEEVKLAKRKRPREAPNVAPLPKQVGRRGSLISPHNYHMFETGTLKQIEEDMRREMELLSAQSQYYTPRTRNEIDANVSMVQQMLEEMEKQQQLAQFSDYSDSETLSQLSLNEYPRSEVSSEESSYLFSDHSMTDWESEMRVQLDTMQKLHTRAAAANEQLSSAFKIDLPFWEQTKAQNCGPTCIHLILTKFGSFVDVGTIQELGMIPDDTYSWPLELGLAVQRCEFQCEVNCLDYLTRKPRKGWEESFKAAERIGVTTKKRKLSLHEILSRLSDACVPIVLINKATLQNHLRGEFSDAEEYRGHFVCVVGYTIDEVIVHDTKEVNGRDVKIPKNAFDACRSDRTGDCVIFVENKPVESSKLNL